jgi:hypothetical protein
MFFDGWDSIARIAVLAAATYFIMVAALRVIGEQALAKMSAYDVIVTVALGSLLVSIPLGSGITLTDGITAICHRAAAARGHPGAREARAPSEEDCEGTPSPRALGWAAAATAHGRGERH